MGGTPGRKATACALCAAALLALSLPAAASAGAKYGSRTMKMGMRGHDVSVLQKFLTKLSLSTPRDSVFGKTTKHNVKRLEKRQGWKRDGVVPPKQAVKIKKLAAKAPKSVAGSGTRFYFYGTTAPTAEVSGSGTVDVIDADGTPVISLDASGGTVAWYGRSSSGKPAPDGDYSFAASGGGSITGGQTTPFELRNHIFPVRGSHDYGGAASRFGAPRSGHTHQGQDVGASCGTPLAAAQGGTVVARAYDDAGGNYIVIKGKGSKKDYVYMHMKGPGPLSKGDTVKTGQRIGKVGDTGDATGCHLHFERWTKPGWYTGGHPYDPLKSLKYWDSYS